MSVTLFLPFLVFKVYVNMYMCVYVDITGISQ